MPISELEGIGVHEAEKERLLEQFRLYLDGIDELPEMATDPGSPEADLFSVFVELAAVRNEVRAESRLVKEALDQFRGVFDTLQSSHATLQQELLRAQGEVRERSQAVLRPCCRTCWNCGTDWRRHCNNLPYRRSEAGSAYGGNRPRAEPETWREGIGIMARRLDRILSDRRVSRLELVGRLFDPRTARAVGTRQDGRFGPGIMVEEVRAAYMWDNDLLRTAEVIVSKADEGDNQS